MAQPQPQQLTFQISPSTLITGVIGLMLVIPITIFLTLWLLRPQIASAGEFNQQANTGVYHVPPAAALPAGSTCVDASAHDKDGEHADDHAVKPAHYPGYSFTSGSITQHQTETNTNYYDSFNTRGDVYRDNVNGSFNGNFAGNTANSNNGNFSGNTANSNNTLNSNNGNTAFSNNTANSNNTSNSNNTAFSNNTANSNNTDVDVDVLSNNFNNESIIDSDDAQNSNTDVENSLGTAVINGNID